VELLIALTITLGLSTMMFQLFHQNERVIRDQGLIMEMQQTARVVASQIADEIRMAGQGVPLSAAKFDTAVSEAVSVVLPSSTSSRIDFRAGLSNVETRVTSISPFDFTLGVSRPVSVLDGSMFSAGKYVYVWTPYLWLRGQLTGASSNSLTLTARQTGSTAAIVHFADPATVSLEEAVSIYLSSGSVRRATASDLTDPASPTWSPANEIGRNFTMLRFTYYDSIGNAVMPTTMSNRQSISRVDIYLTVQTATALSDGARRAYSLALRTVPRNVRIRSGN
jgi:hypothetical protein